MKEIYLQIKKIELIKILKGEKKKECRSTSVFNVEKLCLKEERDGKIYAIGKPEIKSIYFRAGMAKDALYAKIEVKMIRSETFMIEIPEEFKQGDTAISIYLGEIIETNYKKD